MDNKGSMELLKTLAGERMNPSLAPYDEEAEFVKSLNILEYVNPLEFENDTYGSNMRVRSMIRYLICLFPYDSLTVVSKKIHTLLNNKNIQLEDLKIILDARHINNSQERTREVPFIKLQLVGKMLAEGATISSIVNEVGVARETVYSIERYLGIQNAYKMRLVDKAVDAVRDGLSIREFAKKENLSFQIAYKNITKAKSVLEELGETYIERKN